MISLLNDHELRQPGKERFLSWDQLNFTGCDVESLFFLNTVLVVFVVRSCM